MQKNKKLQSELDEISKDKTAYERHRTEVDMLKSKIISITEERDAKTKKYETVKKDCEMLRKQL